MSWARLDDGFHQHRKIAPLPLAAVGLHTKALTYCAANLTDGFVPDSVVTMLVGSEASSALTAALTQIYPGNESAVWTIADGGFRIHDYLHFNPSAADVKKQRRVTAKRVRVYRSRNGVTSSHVHRDTGTGTGTGSVPSSSQTRFAEFYAAYPRHQNRDDAERAWKKLKPDAALLEVMLAAIERQRPSSQWTRAGGQYIPHPATWLNKGGWKDEPTEVQTPLLTPKGQVAKDAADAWLRIHKPSPPERLKLA